MNFTELIIKMVIFVVLMCIGYIAARNNILTPAFSKAASFLVMNVFLTGSVISSVSTGAPDLSGRELIMTMLMLSLTCVLGYVISFVMVRAFKLNRINGGANMLLMSTVNGMFVGLPIMQEVFGTMGTLYAVLFCIPFNLILYTYGVVCISTGSDGSHAKLKFKDVMTIPLIATLVSLVIFIFRIPLPKAVTELAGTLADATMPLSMIVIGATLGSVKLLDAFKEKWVYIVCFIKLVFIPAIVWIILSFITADKVLLSCCVILAGCPSAVVITVLALQYGRDATYTSKGVMASTALSMITLPVLAYLLVNFA